MLRRLTAKSVLVFFMLGVMCVALSAPGITLGAPGFSNASPPTGCAGKIPVLPEKKSERSGVLCCTSDQLFNVLSGGLAVSQIHDFSDVGQLGLGMAPVDGRDEIALLNYLLHTRPLTYPLQKVPIHLLNSVLTV